MCSCVHSFFPSSLWLNLFFSGIVCYDRLEDMLKLVSSQVVKKDGKYVVQKYIGEPVFNCFFCR